MQEDIENKTLSLMINTGKLTERTLATAFMKALKYSWSKAKEHQQARPQGKQSVKKLVGQNQGVDQTELSDRQEAKSFDRYARKYGVDYAVKKDRSSSPPKYLIFFKGRDADALTAAFTEYTGKKVRKAEKSERPSVLAKLSQFKELVKHAVVDRNKRKELER